MKKYLFVSLIAYLFLTGCQEETAGLENSAQGVMVTQTAAATIGECPNGGVVLDLGFDANGNGALDADEVTKSEVVCHGTDGIDGEPGVKGAAGAKGDAGAQGDHGAQGLKGDTGAQGLKGDTGAQGLKGDTGAQGLKGDTGAQGLKGDTGAQGLQGDKGDPGDKGDQGLPGLAGGNGLHCWDINGDGIEDNAEDMNGDFDWNALDCIGPKGDKGDPGLGSGTGLHCWDLNGDGVADISEDINGDFDWNALDCIGAKGDQGDPGVKGDPGDPGLPGVAGLDGLHCWDINGDGFADSFEDINGDFDWNALDCIGAPGLPGAQGNEGDPGVKGDPGDKGEPGAPGLDGLNGLHCWDLDGDGVEDNFEDTNGDIAWDALDCIGDKGDKGDKGDPGVKGDPGAKGDPGDPGAPGLSATGGWGTAWGVGGAFFTKNSDYAWKTLGPMQGMSIDTNMKVFTADEAGVYHITYRLTVLKPMGLKRWASVALFVDGIEQPAARRSVAGGGEIAATVLLDIPANATVSLRNVGATDLYPVDSPGAADDPGADAPSIVFIKLN